MKSKTHIYMANMIIREIKETNSVSLKGYGKYEVPADIVSAITKFPKAFRAGAVGPDFLPDMIVGQTIMHPSNSGMWLERMEKELLSMSENDAEMEEAYAFYLGFHMHYAGDMYGHDYVNGWAKGSFPDLMDAVRDVELAKIIMRHMLVETYMDERVPKSEDLSLSVPVDFVLRCFASEDAAKRYPDSNINVLKYMIELKSKIHQKAQNSTIRKLDIANYFPSWEKDIDDAIREWLKLWSRIAEYFLHENAMHKTKEDLSRWFKEWGPKLTCLPKWLVSFIKYVGDIVEFFNIFKLIENALKAMMKELLKVFVYAVTGVTWDDYEKLIQEIENIFKNPKIYLNNGFLYDDKNITDTLDQEFGNYGVSQDVHNQTFLAYDRCLNMCRMVVMGANNLNALVRKYDSGLYIFSEKTSRPGVHKLDITIKTGNQLYSGTDDDIFFAVILKDGRIFEILLDKPGYNDFEKGDQDTYRFDLPETIYYDTIKSLRIRKDYINFDDDWKMQHVKVVDANDHFVLADKETDVWLKDRESRELDVNTKHSVYQISLDLKVMSHLYSLDGACPKGQPDYKPWNEPKFFLNFSRELRNKVLLPLFALKDEALIEPFVGYMAHVAHKGWLNEVFSGETAGTTGESRRLEAIRVKLYGIKGDICYSVHAAHIGWLPYVKNGEIAGTTGESRRLEAVKIHLENVRGYRVTYRVHMKDKGWSDWVWDDAVAGTTGESRRIEAIEIKLIYGKKL